MLSEFFHKVFLSPKTHKQSQLNHTNTIKYFLLFFSHKYTTKHFQHKLFTLQIHFKYTLYIMYIYTYRVYILFILCTKHYMLCIVMHYTHYIHYTYHQILCEKSVYREPSYIHLIYTYIVPHPPHTFSWVVFLE